MRAECATDESALANLKACWEGMVMAHLEHGRHGEGRVEREGEGWRRQKRARMAAGPAVRGADGGAGR